MLKKLLQLTLVSLLFSACGEEQKSVSPQTQEKPELQLQQASFRELNGFSQDNLTEAFHAFELSCNAIDKIKTPYLGTANIKKYAPVFGKRRPRIFAPFWNKRFNRILSFFRAAAKENLHHIMRRHCMLPVLPASAISIPFTASRMTSLSLIPGILTRKCPPADWWAEWKVKSWFLIIPGGKL